MKDVFENQFAHDVFLQKYSKDGKETWTDTADRCVTAIGYSYARKYIENREFIPGGRYLYSCGRPVHNISNCFAFSVKDTREGWSTLMGDCAQTLLLGGGIGVEYSNLRAKGCAIHGTGGESSGPAALMLALDAIGANVRQGGSRRSALWAGLNWDHPDVFDFIKMKHRTPEQRKLKEKDFNFYLPMEMTNISVGFDDHFLKAFYDTEDSRHQLARRVWKEMWQSAFETADPGASFNYNGRKDILRNACVVGGTTLLTKTGYRPIEECVNRTTEVWNGFEWSEVTPRITGRNLHTLKITFSDGRELICTDYHKFHIIPGYRGKALIVEAKDLKVGDRLIKNDYPIIKDGIDYGDLYAQGFKSADGVNGYESIWVYKPKYVCWGRLTGGKPFPDHSKTKDRKVFSPRLANTARSKEWLPFDGNLSSKLTWLSGLFDGDGTELKEGGLQLVSINREFLRDLQNLLTTLGVQSKIVASAEAGERRMPDGKGGSALYMCQKAYRICIGSIQIQKLKSLGLSCERLKFQKTPQRDASQFVKVVAIEDAGVAEIVYCVNEPKRHLAVFNGIVTGNCNEFTSETSSDSCNLGTIFINRVRDKDHMAEVTRHAVKFLLRGALYTDRPTEESKLVARENNRIGVGLGGIGEWLLARGLPFEVTPELRDLLEVWAEVSEREAAKYAKRLGMNVPRAVRAIAPTGTIAVIAETTGGIEPLFCKAYKRSRWIGDKYVTTAVVDPVAKRLVAQGVPVDQIYDTYDVPFEQRVKFQYDVQQFVDMGISSTVNLPAWGTETNNFVNLPEKLAVIEKYMRGLRGLTVYSDGSIGGQPFVRMGLQEALELEGTIIEGNTETCKGGVCGV